MVSTVGARADNEEDFFARLDRAGVLVRKRLSTRNPDEVTGYAVALPCNTAKGGTLVWYGGGKLATDLTLPKLRCRWHQPHGRGHDRFRTADRNAIWEHTAQIAHDAARKMPFLTATDPAAASDVAWATADTLRAAAEALSSPTLHQAADAYDRAARLPHGRVPRPSPFGNQLRQAARVLSTVAWATGNRSLAAVTLIVRLAALAEAVASLREAQERVTQAANARTASERLYAVAGSYPPTPARKNARRPTAAQLAATSFPMQPHPQQSARGQAQSGRASFPLIRRLRASRPRGPSP